MKIAGSSLTDMGGKRIGFNQEVLAILAVIDPKPQASPKLTWHIAHDVQARSAIDRPLEKILIRQLLNDASH
jgi:hypothetical protein